MESFSGPAFHEEYVVGFTFSSEQRSCSGNALSTATQDFMSAVVRGRMYAFNPDKPGHCMIWSLGVIAVAKAIEGIYLGMNACRICLYAPFNTLVYS